MKTRPVDFAEEGLEALRNAAFPVYVVPPARWPGDVMLGGVSGSKEHPLWITVRYDDDVLVDHPSRRIVITSTGPEGLGTRSPQDSFLLWEHSYFTDIINFVHNLTSERLPERPIAGSERFNAEIVDGKMVPRTVYLPSAGPRRLVDTIPFDSGFQIEHVGFIEYPDLRMYRLQMPEAEVSMLAWGWDGESLTQFVTSMVPVQEDEETFSELEQAQRAAWEKIRRRER